MNIYFKCTHCGNCCRDTKIPLTVAEAVQWLQRGHRVQLLCEASPWPQNVADEDPRAAHFKRRSFAVQSGSMPARVVVLLVANIVGACPNLLADRRCGIYEDRPLVCRIYPAEVNPAVALKPENKACPPEAWTSDQPLLQQNGVLVDDAIRLNIQQSRAADMLDASVKKRLCHALNVVDTAAVHEAMLVYSPTAESLLSALNLALSTNADEEIPTQWRFLSDRAETIEAVERNGGTAVHLRDAVGLSSEHVKFKREALFGPYL
jgi:Fe-S-cluster containining protein